ncbi:MAG TPA: hypothetical protein PLB45_00505 [Bacilli bacterium]|nr:hypothetical protein [Bacilli bacterium]
MAVNRNNTRVGFIRERSQMKNKKIGLYIKRDTSSGKFMDVKTTGGKFKSVRKEK